MAKAQGSSAGDVPSVTTNAGNEMRFALANGLKVYLIRDKRFPLVCTRLYVRTGSANEKAKDYGISHVLEHMVFKGTQSRPKGQIARDVESLGGYLNAYTSLDKTCYLTDMPARHWQMGIDVVRDMAFHPLLDPAELEKEKPVIISEMEGNEDDPSGRLFLEVQKAALAGSPYGHPIIGTRDTVNAVTVDSLRAYIDAWYQPQNMLLVVAGDIDPTEVRSYVEKSFSPYANSHYLPDLSLVEPSSLTVTDKARVDVLRGKWNKVYLGLAFPVPGITDFNALNLDLAAYLLAGDGTTPFERKYRNELHIVDNISVGNMSFARLGLFTISAVLDADKTEQFFTELVRDLARFDAASFSAEELARAKFVLEDDYDRNSETLNKLTSWRAQMEFDLGGRMGESNMRRALRTSSLEQIGKAWHDYIRPEMLSVRVLAPEGANVGDLAGILAREWPALNTMEQKQPVAGEEAREYLSLDNGIRLVLIPDVNIPYLSVHMTSQGGNALLDKKTQGLATLVANTLTNGCGGLDRIAFEKALAEKALGISAKGGRQSFSISGTSPARFGEDLLKLMSEVFLSPRFEEKEIAKEKKDMESARRIRDDDSLGYLTSRLWPALFGDHPYGYDSLGTTESVGSFGRKDVEDYWKRQQDEPWIVVAAGTFDRNKIVAWASSLPKVKGSSIDVASPSWSGKKELALRVPDKNKAHLLELWPTVPQTHDDAPALSLLQAILAGQSGLLFSQMRDEESLGYTVTAQNLFFQKTGLAFFYAGTTPDKIAQAKQGFADIVQLLQHEELDSTLLAAGCNTLEGSYVRSRQSLSARAGEAAVELLLGLPRDFARLQIEKARKLTTKDLQEVARRYFVKPYVAVALP